jgi:5-methylcytosine-specific restriction endonuclease McrA
MNTSNHKARTKDKGGGSFTIAEWNHICRQYDNRCVACGRRRKLVPDHVTPVAFGGTSNIDNIQPLCHECNGHKSNAYIDCRQHPFNPERNRVWWIRRAIVGYQTVTDNHGRISEQPIYEELI